LVLDKIRIRRALLGGGSESWAKHRRNWSWNQWRLRIVDPAWNKIRELSRSRMEIMLDTATVWKGNFVVNRTVLGMCGGGGGRMKTAAAKTLTTSVMGGFL
jgi:hypothetical protein